MSLQHSSRLFLRRQVVAVLTSSIATAFNAVLIALFRILFSLITLLVGSFCIIFFISFNKTVWLIFRGKRKS